MPYDREALATEMMRAMGLHTDSSWRPAVLAALALAEPVIRQDEREDYDFHKTATGTHAVQLARAEERERCARIVDDYEVPKHLRGEPNAGDGVRAAKSDIAAAIRASAQPSGTPQNRRALMPYYRIATPEQKKILDGIDELEASSLDSLRRNVTHCRERSVALTYLQTGFMWARRAVMPPEPHDV